MNNPYTANYHLVIFLTFLHHQIVHHEKKDEGKLEISKVALQKS